MTHGKIFICWLLYNSVQIYSIYSRGRIAPMRHTENFSSTIILTVWNINETLLKTYSSVCGKTLLFYQMSDQIQLTFAAATILTMKALSALHWSHTGLNMPALSVNQVVDTGLLRAEKIPQCLLWRYVVAICEDDMWNYVQGKSSMFIIRKYLYSENLKTAFYCLLPPSLSLTQAADYKGKQKDSGHNPASALAWATLPPPRYQHSAGALQSNHRNQRNPLGALETRSPEQGSGARPPAQRGIPRCRRGGRLSPRAQGRGGTRRNARPGQNRVPATVQTSVAVVSPSAAVSVCSLSVYLVRPVTRFQGEGRNKEQTQLISTCGSHGERLNSTSLRTALALLFKPRTSQRSKIKMLY